MRDFSICHCYFRSSTHIPAINRDASLCPENIALADDIDLECTTVHVIFAISLPTYPFLIRICSLCHSTSSQHCITWHTETGERKREKPKKRFPTNRLTIQSTTYSLPGKPVSNRVRVPQLTHRQPCGYNVPSVFYKIQTRNTFLP